MKALAGYRDTDRILNLASQIRALPLRHPLRLMEVCGGHTAAIYRYGLRQLLPAQIELVSGPGCPVCVTPTEYIDHAIAIACLPNVTVTTFGDLLRVPGTHKSLNQARADGSDVRVVYSPADALVLARSHPDRIIVFLGIGFETSACTIAAATRDAVREKLMNFKLLSAVKTMPCALAALLSDSETHVDGLILPGHVTAITGTAPFEFIARGLGIACCVSGFEPLDLLQSIQSLATQIVAGSPQVLNSYRRAVRNNGNVLAREIMYEMFEPCAMMWRGLGEVPASGLRLKPDFAEWDAASLTKVPAASREHPGCRCGAVLRGECHPVDCRLFGTACTPESPVGACMVSTEGACAAVYHYQLADAI